MSNQENTYHKLPIQVSIGFINPQAENLPDSAMESEGEFIEVVGATNRTLIEFLIEGVKRSSVQPRELIWAFGKQGLL